jgi:hypothetical protein
MLPDLPQRTVTQATAKKELALIVGQRIVGHAKEDLISDL